MVDALGAFLLSKADGHHLHQAAFIGAAERGVGLDAVEEDDPVCLRGVFVHKHRLMAHTGNADLNSFHGVFHRTAHGFFGNAIVLEDLIPSSSVPKEIAINSVSRC